MRLAPHLPTALALLVLAAVPAGAQDHPPFRPHPQGQGQRFQGQPRVQPQGQNVRPQEAQRRRGGNGAGIAAGVIGGLAAGAILGGVLSNRGGYAEPVEGGPGYGPAGGCPLVRRPVYDGAGRFAGYQDVPSC